MKDGKVALVTGGARGIGRAVCFAFARAGYKVLVNYLSSESAAKEMVAEIVGAGGHALEFCADVSDSSAVDEMFEFCAAELGKPEILVNNAGRAENCLFDEISDKSWREMLAHNLDGAFYCSRAATRIMLEIKRGVIINISSVWGERGAACEAHYSASKAGLIGLTRSLAKELAPAGIRVNCITPGVIQTEMLGEYTVEELEALCEEIPLGYLGRPEDVAETVLFLASDKARYLTGQVVGVNGGFYL